MRVKPIQKFEFDKLLLKEEGMTEEIYEALEKYYGSEGTDYYKLINKGIQFNQYVGVIQVGQQVIEVLPKVDRLTSSEDQKMTWKEVLIQMLRVTHGIKARSTSEADLTIQTNSVLDLYTELFIEECEKITHRGLAKNYIRRKENRTALKGRLNVTKHIRTNIVHKERFFVDYDSFETNHLINQILKKTLEVLGETTRDGYLINRIRKQQLFFLDMKDLRINEDLFSKVYLNRRSSHYERALNIAKMILLNYHPDISMGRENVLALMFNMNDLWEKFITQQIRKGLGQFYTVKAQSRKLFWKTEDKSKYLIPDMIINSHLENEKSVVIDTKWKLPANMIPSDQDLRQMFAYNRLFDLKKSILLYPGQDNAVVGHYRTAHGGTCDIVTLNILDNEGQRLNLGEDCIQFIRNHLEKVDYWAGLN